VSIIEATPSALIVRARGVPGAGTAERLDMGARSHW
jgi:hypothetical protein